MSEDPPLSLNVVDKETGNKQREWGSPRKKRKKKESGPPSPAATTEDRYDDERQGRLSFSVAAIEGGFDGK